MQAIDPKDPRTTGFLFCCVPGVRQDPLRIIHTEQEYYNDIKDSKTSATATENEKLILPCQKPGVASAGDQLQRHT
jgi:hypothetical protein